MRIATWNLRRPTNPKSPRRQRLRAVMERIAADIWILTETHVELAPAPGMVGISSIGVDREGEPRERWAMVWSRFPVEHVEASVRSVCAQVLAPKQTLLVVATVLPWRTDKRPQSLTFKEHFANEVAQQRDGWQSMLVSHPDTEMC